ncbi:MAG: amidophosphoribosyltransferase [candidate division Zixibacteria bacterium RBG_16_43_9]|nr:MAG: amidophosphoribosyltransferase [candidate division Zixibacteria bacterium RBG_16_43_9]
MIENLLHEDCGIFAIFGAKKASELTYLGLYALQHRGQEASGIVSSDGNRLYQRKGMGQVNEVFASKEVLSSLRGEMAIGHNRYSTTGSSTVANIQPLQITYKGDKLLAVGHNGNLTNSTSLRKKLEKEGSIFQTTTDSEIILHLIARSKKEKIEDSLADALSQVSGAYSLVFITADSILAARDPYGWRPLALGKLKDAWVVASETCAFDMIGAKYLRDVQPGEILLINEKGLKSITPFKKVKHAFCIFEFIYFARPDSMIFGENVDKVRRRLGRQLAKEQPADADIVIAVPDSSNTHTLGYSEQSGIKFEVGLIRNHYIGRTFIQPEQKIRDLDARIKYNPVKGVLKDKRIVIVDDSIVRGTTSRKLVWMLRNAGAKEVHFRVSSPPITSPCFYGIDMPTKRELIASAKSVEQIRRYLGVDSLGYLSIEGMLSMPSLPKESFCVACFSGRYPTKIENNIGKFALELK